MTTFAAAATQVSAGEAWACSIAEIVVRSAPADVPGLVSAPM